jgi:hypothetical protein
MSGRCPSRPRIIEVVQKIPNSNSAPAVGISPETKAVFADMDALEVTLRPVPGFRHVGIGPAGEVVVQFDDPQALESGETQVAELLAGRDHRFIVRSDGLSVNL